VTTRTPEAQPGTAALPAAPTGPHVDTAIATLRGELARSDGKASLLLALTGAAALALVSLGAGGSLPAAAVAVGAVSAAAMLAATVVLLLAVRPHLAGRGWPSWPDLADAELQAQLAEGQHVEEVRVLATSARTKFRRIRLAVDLVLVGLAFLAVAAVLAAAL
jgi:hypothetical protein